MAELQTGMRWRDQMGARGAAAGVDIALCFVPQWTPFQPPLSLPSLAAWLHRANFSTAIVDANVGFYDFLLSGRSASILLSEPLPEPRNRSGRERRQAARQAVASWKTYRADIEALTRWGKSSHETCQTSRAKVLASARDAVRSLETYLRHVTALSPRFYITPYGFRARYRVASMREIEGFVEDPPLIIKDYVQRVVQQLLATKPKMVGLSCVGFSQLEFTLLIGRAIKQQSDVPVVVGGSIFPRIIERGALPAPWLGKYVDVIVQNEGEKPLEALLRLPSLDSASLRQIAGIIFADDDEIVTTPAAALLLPKEVPPPDFTNMPLQSYFTSTVTFPIIASRGCYWGKCEFCHVAVEKYSNYKTHDVIATIQMLHEKHGARLFFFHDYAIPPSVFRRLGRELPRDQAIYMAGLIKFEKYFQAEDFANAHRAGFRLLQIGLESASERVLALMRKNSSRQTMLANLSAGAGAGIWMHCFVLYGFPGEQRADAEQTTEFMLEHSDIIGSFEGNRFELEHNAPIMRHAKEFGVTRVDRSMDDVSVYYEHEVSGGVDSHEAMRFLSQLYDTALRKRKYGAIAWIPQQLLFVLLTLFSPDELVEACAELQDSETAVARMSDMLVERTM